ncbi:major allergen Equ c 1 [Desmodus rotundus]|uniref:major allergen Equ c 1 n=1 Tax=Desmodus rotundus TaxID=9430 RepID=UPI00238121B7|nr:major allergen Equ c 1-like [Desmodus rotundus]
MKLLLHLCLGLTLVYAHHQGSHDVVTCNLDMSQISGEWHNILLASDVKEMIEENGTMRLFLEYIQALDNSSLLIKCHKKIDGACAELTFICDETEEKGVYSVTYEGYNTFRIIEAVYNEYLILYALNFNNEEKTQLMGLKARNPDVRPELKKRFEELGRNRGIPQENILDVSEDGKFSSLWFALPESLCY